MIFAFSMLLYPVSASAAETYRVDFKWYGENFANPDFISNYFQCDYNLFLLTKYGEKFFATKDLFADDINFATESVMQLMMFVPENYEMKEVDELKETSLDITIYSDAIVVKDIDLVFYKNDKNIVTKVEHKKKDVSKSFVFHNGPALGTIGNDMYFYYDWGNQDISPITCLYKLEKVQ